VETEINMVDWPEGKQCISDEEKDLRWDWFEGKYKGTLDEFNAEIAEIRKRTGKP